MAKRKGKTKKNVTIGLDEKARNALAFYSDYAHVSQPFVIEMLLDQVNQKELLRISLQHWRNKLQKERYVNERIRIEKVIDGLQKKLDNFWA